MYTCITHGPRSGVVQAKSGLQWQQPFLELVLACMRVQNATHEELLGPLKSQLSNFLVVFEKVSLVLATYMYMYTVYLI